MNRLWVRLALYFSGVVLLGAILIGITARLLVTDSLRQSFLPGQLRAPGGIVETLTEYYRTHGSWDGVNDLLDGMRASTALWSPGLDLALVDRQGQFVYHSRRGQSGPMLGRVVVPVPLAVDGMAVGELQVRLRPAEFRNRVTRGPLEQLSRYLLLAALIGGALGLIFSFRASRSLTEPLNRLAAAARDIGARNFSRRVTASGTDEVVAVAHAFNEMATELEKSATLRRNLVADVAHELRTPLSVLQGNLRALLDDLYPLDKAEVAKLYTQTRLLNRLVNDLHELAQADAGQLSLNRQPVDLNPLVVETVATYEPSAEEDGVQIETVLAAGLPLLPADPGRLTQILHNLIANALRHTPAGGKIRVQTEALAAMIRLTVQDTGEGIAAEHLPYVFERFYRTDPARARERGNAGLGLAIVRALVEAHGGQVQVSSPGLGQGTTFTLELPLTN